MQKIFSIILTLLVSTCWGTSLSVDCNWDKNLENADLVHITQWAQEQYKKLNIELNQIRAEMPYQTPEEFQRSLEKERLLLNQMIQLKQFYIQAITVEAPKIIGRLPQ